MSRLLSVTATLLVFISGAVSQTGAQVQKAIGSIELPSAPPCVPSKSKFDKDKVYDVLKVLLQSDGKRITIAATLKDPPPARPGYVLGLYFDTDNNPKTGADAPSSGRERGGFEFESVVEACARYTGGGVACADASQDGKVTSHYTIATLERFTGSESNEFNDRIIDFFHNNATEEPIIGNMVHATLKYADLKVQPSQTIRILVEKECGDSGYVSSFPEVLLVLK